MQSSPLNTCIPRRFALKSSPMDTARSERLISCRCFPDPASWYTCLLDVRGKVFRMWMVTISREQEVLLLPCLAYPVVSVERWGTTDDLATSSLHSSRLSAFLMAAPSVKPVHSGMLSSHLFLCLPHLRPSWTVPCMTVLASPVDLVMWPYHLSFRCLTVVRRSSCGPMA